MSSIHVDVCTDSVIYKGIRLGNAKGRVPGICGITNQGKLLGGKGKAFGEGSMAVIKYMIIF